MAPNRSTELSFSEAGLAIVGSLPDPMFAVDEAGRIAWANDALMARVDDDVTGRGLRDLVDDPAGTLARTLSLAWSSSQAKPCQLSLRGAADSSTHAEHWRVETGAGPLVVFRLLAGESGAERFVLLSETIERINGEIQSRRETERSLQVAIEELETANATKDRVLAEVSHDLRTPLNAIIGFSEMLAKGIGGTLTERHHEYAKLIHASGASLLELIDQILTVASRCGASTLQVEEPTSLASCLRSCELAVGPLLVHKKLSLELPAENDLPEVMIDRGAVTSVLRNLVDNAVKFSHEGETVSVMFRPSLSGGLMITVRDRGPGIPRDRIDQITAPFVKFDTAERPGIGGFGLGMAIVKRRIDEMQGTLSIDSVVGRGTAITVTIPANLVVWPKRSRPAA